VSVIYLIQLVIVLYISPRHDDRLLALELMSTFC